MVHKVVAHEIDIALVTGHIRPHVLVKTDAFDLTEIQITFFMPLNGLLADGTGTGGHRLICAAKLPVRQGTLPPFTAASLPSKAPQRSSYLLEARKSSNQLRRSLLV